MRFVSEDESKALVDHDLAFAATREALIEACSAATTTFPVVIGHGSDTANRFTIKAAATEIVAGLKIGSYWPDNLSRGIPRHNSLILLFDQTIGKIAVAIEAGIVNAYRTAAADAVAATYLARPDSTALAIFGTGNQARYEVAALRRVRSIQSIFIVGRTEQSAVELRDELRAEGVEAESVTAKEACANADIIVTATAARAPLFDAEWVRPGAHVATMGSDGRGKQELPPGLFARGSLFCDAVEQSRAIGEFQHAEVDRTLTAVGKVITGTHPGRTSRDEITIFDSSGLSLQDLVIARHLLAKLDE